MASFKQQLINRRELVIFVLMLEFLHFSIWIDFGNLLSRSFILVHLGLFLIWQPVWRRDERITWYNSLIFFVVTIIFLVFMNWWLMFGWLILLSGFAGGRVIISQQERNTYMIALIFLTSELIIKCTPEVFNISVPGNIDDLFYIILPLLPLLITFVPIKPETRTFSVDIFHSVTTSTLLGVLIFGSLLNMYLSETEYLLALVQTLLVIALFLFAISWLLSPRSGFSGFSQLWANALLNLGTPFEQWLAELSKLAQQRRTAEELLEAAMDELVSIPWIAGVDWSSSGESGKSGQATKYRYEFNTENLQVTVYTNNRIGGALSLHCRLLLQLLENFYISKIRERKLAQSTHLQAIHETGARVTHDIKNLLQSLQALTSVVLNESENKESKPISQQLLEKQLPHLTHRLQLALDKLQEPAKTSLHELVYLKDWWEDMKSRNNQNNIEFHADISTDSIIPVDLFNNVLENLLENLKDKAQIATQLAIKISLSSDPRSISLVVCDNGNKIPDHQAKLLFKEPLKSDNGLGIGMYQAARLAEESGYVLALKYNQDGKVCFELCSSIKQENISGATLGQAS